MDQPATELPAAAGGENSIPSPEKPFEVAEHPPGVRFYAARSGFFHPYALLQSMSFRPDLLTLSFAGAEVTIAGRGLHTLYVPLAEHRVAWIMEQGERYAAASEAPVHVTKIVHIMKGDGD